MSEWLELLHTLDGLPAYALLLGLLIACGIGAPINEDIVLLVAAALTLTGVMEQWPLIAVSWLGLLSGDALVFHWGHRFGARWLRGRLFSGILPPERLDLLQARIRRHGPAYIFAIRFMPGIRTALFFAAGSMKLPYRHLFIYDGLAAAIELPLLVYAVRYVGGRWEQILESVNQLQGSLLVLALLLVATWWARRLLKQRKAKPQ